MHHNNTAIIQAFGKAMGVDELTPAALRSFPLVLETTAILLDYNQEAAVLIARSVIGKMVDDKEDSLLPLLAANAYQQGTGDAWIGEDGGMILLFGCFYPGAMNVLSLIEALNTFCRTAAAWKEALADNAIVSSATTKPASLLLSNRA